MTETDPATEDETGAAPEDAAPEAPPVRPRRRDRWPAVVAATFLVGTGLILSLFGMRQVVAKAPPMPPASAGVSAPPPSAAAPVPTATPSMAPNPAGTSSPVILLP